MKNKLLNLLLPSSLLPIPFVISCSANNDEEIINKANEIYKNVWNEMQNSTNIAKNNIYPNAIYDFETFRKFTNVNSIKNVDGKYFNVLLTDFNYDFATEGILNFKFYLQNKQNNKTIIPSPKEGDQYYSNNISVKGFKKISNDLLKLINDTYKKINNFEFNLNQKGIDLVLTHRQNLNSNINFDSNDENNFFNLLSLPKLESIEINSSKVNFNSVYVNDQISSKMIIDEIRKKVTFNFWILMNFKDENNDILSLPISIGNNNYNLMHQIVINYEPIINSYLLAEDFQFTNIEEASKLITPEWILKNKIKIFNSLSLPLLNENILIEIKEVKNYSSSIDVHIKLSLKSNKNVVFDLKTMIIGFK